MDWLLIKSEYFVLPTASPGIHLTVRWAEAFETPVVSQGSSDQRVTAALGSE